MATFLIVGVILAGLGAWLCFVTGSRTLPLLTLAIWGLLLLAGVLVRSWARNADVLAGVLPEFILLVVILPALAVGLIGGSIGIWRRKRRPASV